MNADLPNLGAHQVPFREYLRWPAVNWTLLKEFRLSAKHGRHAMLCRADATEPQVLGDAGHAAILEPDRFAAEYVAMPEFDGHPNSNAHKEAKANWRAANASKIHLTAEEHGMALCMSHAVRVDRHAGPLVTAKGKNELSILWKEAETGTVCKSRLDMLRKAPFGILAPNHPQAAQDAGWLVDIKTTKSIEPHAFARDCAKYGYHAQLASYDLAARSIQDVPYIVAIIAVENHPPYDVAVFRLPDAELEEGRRLFRRLLKDKAAAEESKVWPGIGDEGIMSLQLPAWAKELDDAA